MNEDEKLEYQELRDEFALLNQMIATTMNFSVAGCIVAFSIIFPKIEPEGTILLYWLPLLIIYPSCWLIASRIKSMHRIGTYIIIFIEPLTKLKWESRLMVMKEIKSLRFRNTILGIYVALLAFDIIIFISKGYFRFEAIASYLVSILLFWRVYWFMTKGWKEYYLELWKEVKLKEEGLMA